MSNISIFNDKINIKIIDPGVVIRMCSNEQIRQRSAIFAAWLQRVNHLLRTVVFSMTDLKKDALKKWLIKAICPTESKP